MGWITRTRVWLKVLPSIVNRTELRAHECRGSLFLSQGINPPHLPDRCNGCGTEFYICHCLDCKKGGLITARHNELYDGVANLLIKDFTPPHVRGDPKIYTGRAVGGGKENIKGSPQKDEGDLKGDLLIRDLWTQGKESIQDMRVMNTDTTSYQSKKTPISAWKLLRRIRRRSILTPASISVRNSLPLSPQWKAFLRLRQMRHLNLTPAALRRSGRNPNHVPAGM